MYILYQAHLRGRADSGTGPPGARPQWLKWQVPETQEDTCAESDNCGELVSQLLPHPSRSSTSYLPAHSAVDRID